MLDLLIPILLSSYEYMQHDRFNKPILLSKCLVPPQPFMGCKPKTPSSKLNYTRVSASSQTTTTLVPCIPRNLRQCYANLQRRLTFLPKTRCSIGRCTALAILAKVSLPQLHVIACLPFPVTPPVFCAIRDGSTVRKGKRLAIQRR